MKFNFGSIRQWHWVSSALCLVGMFLFSITGITLNHAKDIRISPNVSIIEGELPTTLLERLRNYQSTESSIAVPPALSFWLEQTHSVVLSSTAVAEWSQDELYVVQSSPGFDQWIAVDFISGEFSYESTDRGWIAYFNDLHKGRDTGTVWGWFLDMFAVASVVFCISGFILLWRQTNHRWMTWPVTALGAIVPLIILLLFVH